MRRGKPREWRADVRNAVAQQRSQVCRAKVGAAKREAGNVPELAYSVFRKVAGPHGVRLEGLFDLAVLWQAGFRHATCAIGTHLTPAQTAQLSDRPGRSVSIVFDQDQNHASQQASQRLATRLQAAGVAAHIVPLPLGNDPNSYFAAGATGADFTLLLRQAHQP